MTFLIKNHDLDQKPSFYLLKIVNSVTYASQSLIGIYTHSDLFHHATDNDSVSDFVQAMTISMPSAYVTDIIYSSPVNRQWS